MQKESPVLRILHFNDVYDIQPKTKTNTAGAYYFKAHLQKHRTENSLTLFSGDAFSPSILSNIFSGNQMVHCLNLFKIDIACYGNHQFDYDIDQTINLASKCNFPWILGNLIDVRTSKPLGDAQEYHIIDKNGLKVGIFGVAEEEWITLLTEDYHGQIQYTDFVKYSAYQAKYLRQIRKCDLIVALTHMRVPNDQKLARQVPEIDIILGGHDHSIHNQMIGTTHIIKTGCNFNHLSVIDIYPKTHVTAFQGKKYNQTVQLINITAVQDYDQKLKLYVDHKLKAYEEENQKVIGYTLVPLETRFEVIRKKQTNYGNFITDLIRAFYNIDAVTLQSGTIRSDCILEPGPLKYSTVSNVFDAFLIVKFVPGRIIHELLEHSVSKYPSFQGRFMMISGIRFAFDAAREPYQRVQKESITMNGFPLDYDKIYKVGMNEYVGKGGDGYTCLTDCKEYIQAQNAIKFTTLLMKFYRLHELNQKKSQQSSSGEQAELKPLRLFRATSSRSDRISQFIKKIEQVDGRFVVFIEPFVDGRIKIINQM